MQVIYTKRVEEEEEEWVWGIGVNRGPWDDDYYDCIVNCTISARSDEVDRVMDALYAIDGGSAPPDFAQEEEK